MPLPDEDKCGRSSWTKERLAADNFERCYADGLQRLDDQCARRDNLETLGRERALFYLLAVSTGLRWGELVSLTIGQLHLNAMPTPYLDLDAEDAKSGKSANIPLRAEVASELHRHLAQRPDTRYDDPLFIKPPAMRHSRMELTMNYYTDPTLLDIAGAVNALLAFGNQHNSQGSDRPHRV